jgi:hypothetical protein
MQLSPYAKAILAVALPLLGTIATAIQAAISDDVITGNEWTKIGIALATALVTGAAVFKVPNRGTAAQAATMSVIGPDTPPATTFRADGPAAGGPR